MLPSSWSHKSSIGLKDPIIERAILEAILEKQKLYYYLL